MISWALVTAALASAPQTLTAGAMGGPPTLDAPAPIIEGEAATAEEYPMTGGLLVEVELDMFGFVLDDLLLMCSSTLIAPDTVLLAAHCLDLDYYAEAVESFGGSLEVVDVGWAPDSDLSMHAMDGVPTEWPATAHVASDYIVHQDFDILSMGLGLSLNYDIGLMFLEEPVLDVPHAYLITPDEVDQIQEGIEVAIVGWGQQTPDQQPPPGTVGFKMQAMSHIEDLADYEFQVGLKGSRKCHGDSGGPSFMWVEADTPELMRQIGVTSHAVDMDDCAKGGVDTRVDYFFDWIEAEMVSRCEAGTRSWCDEYGIVLPPTGDENEDTGGGDTGANGTGDGGGGDGGGDSADTGITSVDSGVDVSGGCGCTSGATGLATGLGPAILVLGAAARRRRES